MDYNDDPDDFVYFGSSLTPLEDGKDLVHTLFLNSLDLVGQVHYE